MSGIPYQKRTEYCFWISGLKRGNDKFNSETMDAQLWFNPPPPLTVNLRDKGFEELKFQVKNIKFLTAPMQPGSWYFAYKGPWTSGEAHPYRSELIYSSDSLHVKVKAYKRFRAGPGKVFIVPLKAGNADKEYKIMDCEECNGRTQISVTEQLGKEDYEKIVYEKECPKCYGLGKVEYVKPIEPWEKFDFVDKHAFDIFQEKMKKALDEYDEILYEEEKTKYDKFIKRLEEEKIQIDCKDNKRKRKRK